MVLTGATIANTIADVIRIPTPDQHKAFLYNDWQPHRLTVAVFIDPLCPYCKKAIPKLDTITDYNLFVYWAPIFGERSEKIIRPFFHCEKPTADSILYSFVGQKRPASKKSLIEKNDSVEKSSLVEKNGLAKKSSLIEKNAQANRVDNCNSTYDEVLRALNDKMVDSYRVNSVPAFYLQGKRVSLARLANTEHSYSAQSGPNKNNPDKQKPAKFVNGVAIDWQRYRLSKVREDYRSQNLAIILPKRAGAMKALIKQYQPMYAFSAMNRQTVCRQISLEICSKKSQQDKMHQLLYQEIIALLGLENNRDSDYGYIVSMGGRIKTLAVVR